MPTRHSSTRKHSAAHKVYISNHARDNQYLLANLELTDALINGADPTFSATSKQPYKVCYRTLRNQVFALCVKHQLTTAHFIANDKIPMVRFSGESDAIETDNKIIFFYNPKYHQGQKYFFNFDVRAKRISILFLANGEDIRINAGLFHQKVAALLSELSANLNLPKGGVRLRDHQHITYDLFGQKKEKAETQSHKFRQMAVRYQNSDVTLPAHRALTYVIADVSINAKIRELAKVNYDAPLPYQPIYTLITDAFTGAMDKHGLTSGAVIANGLIPLVRFSEESLVRDSKGFQMLGFNPAKPNHQIISEWHGELFADKIRLVFLASDEDCTDRGFGKYVNQITKVLESIGETLHIDQRQEQLMVRVHQHIAYDA